MSKTTKKVEFIKEEKPTVDGTSTYYYVNVDGHYQSDSFSLDEDKAREWYEKYLNNMNMHPVITVLESVIKEVEDE